MTLTVIEHKQRAAEAAELYRMYLELGTLEAVGNAVDLSKARISQIFKNHGYKVKRLTEEEIRENARQYRKRYYEKNKKKLNIASRRWALDNPEKMKAAVRENYRRRMAIPGERKKHNKRMRDWHAANPGKAYEANLRFAAKYPERVKESQRKWREKNPNKVKGYALKSQAKKKLKEEQGNA